MTESISDAPVRLDESEPTTVSELELALAVLRKTVDEVAAMEPGVQKATVVSGLYRAFQELTEEVREMREFALLDAAVELSQEGWTDADKAEVKFFEPQDEPPVFNLYYGFKKLYRVNKMIVMNLPNGKRKALEPFSNDSEPQKIAERSYDKVRKALKTQREWEKKFGRPSPHPQYTNYQNR